MQNETVSRRYAVAIFSLAKESGRVDVVGKDLHAAAAAISPAEAPPRNCLRDFAIAPTSR